jgi:hypothetical protein
VYELQLVMRLMMAMLSVAVLSACAMQSSAESCNSVADFAADRHFPTPEEALKWQLSRSESSPEFDDYKVALSGESNVVYEYVADRRFRHQYEVYRMPEGWVVGARTGCALP